MFENDEIRTEMSTNGDGLQTAMTVTADVPICGRTEKVKRTLRDLYMEQSPLQNWY